MTTQPIGKFKSVIIRLVTLLAHRPNLRPADIARALGEHRSHHLKLHLRYTPPITHFSRL